MKKENIEFLKRLQQQMLWEDKHDNDIQASPRFWVIMDYRTEPTSNDYADDHSYYHNDGDFIEFNSNRELIDYLKEYYFDDYHELVKLCFTNYDVREDEIIEDMEFEDLWEIVTDHLNENGFFDDVPTKTVSYIVENTMFITKKDAKDYLKTYGYNHSDKAHTFAMTAIRSSSVQRLFDILHHEDFKEQIDYENLAKVTYAYGVVSQEYGDDADLVWEEIEDHSITILNEWHKYKDIQSIDEEGYVIPYAIRKWEEYMEEKVKK